MRSAFIHVESSSSQRVVLCRQALLLSPLHQYKNTNRYPFFRLVFRNICSLKTFTMTPACTCLFPVRNSTPQQLRLRPLVRTFSFFLLNPTYAPSLRRRPFFLRRGAHLSQLSFSTNRITPYLHFKHYPSI